MLKTESQRRKPQTSLPFDHYIHTEEVSLDSISAPYAVTLVWRTNHCAAAHGLVVKLLTFLHFCNKKNSNKNPSFTALWGLSFLLFVII